MKKYLCPKKCRAQELNEANCYARRGHLKQLLNIRPVMWAVGLFNSLSYSVHNDQPTECRDDRLCGNKEKGVAAKRLSYSVINKSVAARVSWRVKTGLRQFDNCRYWSENQHRPNNGWCLLYTPGEFFIFQQDMCICPAAQATWDTLASPCMAGYSITILLQIFYWDSREKNF